MAELLLGGIGGLTGLAAVLRTWFHRHDGKKIHFEFNDHQVDLEGLSESQLADVVRSLSNFDRTRPAEHEGDEGERS